MRLSKFLLCYFFCSLFLSADVFAQKSDKLKGRSYSNSVKVFHGGLYIPKWFPIYGLHYKRGMPGYLLNVDLQNSRKFRFMIVGGAYERRIYKNWFAAVYYTQWKDVFKVRGDGRSFYVDAAEKKHPRTIGELDSRINYKMADLSILYRKSTNNGRHHLSAGLGVSYCRGWNAYVKSYGYSQLIMESVTIMEIKEIDYTGVVPAIGYDFSFLKNHVSIGPEIKARVYAGRPEAEYNINFRLGVNF